MAGKHFLKYDINLFQIFIYSIETNKQLFIEENKDNWIHFLKKGIFLNFDEEKVKNMKRDICKVGLSLKDLLFFEKKYKKSKYVVNDFWNEYFKTKKKNNSYNNNSVLFTSEYGTNQTSELHSIITHMDIVSDSELIHYQTNCISRNESINKV